MKFLEILSAPAYVEGNHGRVYQLSLTIKSGWLNPLSGRLLCQGLSVSTWFVDTGLI